MVAKIMIFANDLEHFMRGGYHVKNFFRCGCRGIFDHSLSVSESEFGRWPFCSISGRFLGWRDGPERAGMSLERGAWKLTSHEGVKFAGRDKRGDSIF